MMKRAYSVKDRAGALELFEFVLDHSLADRITMDRMQKNGELAAYSVTIFYHENYQDTIEKILDKWKNRHQAKTTSL